MFQWYRILITPVVSILGLCLKTSFYLIFVRHLPYGVSVKKPHAQALQKVWDFIIWWWHLFLLHCLTISLSQNLVLDFCYPSWRILLLTSLLTSSFPLLMFIKIWQPVISSTFLRLSHESFTIFSILIPDSPYYTIMGAINIAFVRWSKAQLRSKRPRIKSIDPAASAIPSTFAPSSSDGRVTVEAIMAQL